MALNPAAIQSARNFAALAGACVAHASRSAVSAATALPWFKSMEKSHMKRFAVAA
jgi:hypothetical protein